MSSGKPYVGCKLGLISKAQNRYEGILYTIDTINSAIVLAKVKCFGTEGRRTDKPIPAKHDIFEYITFRGTDIKDITLCEPSRSHYGLPHDPAILQSSRSSSSVLYATHGRFSPPRMPFYNEHTGNFLLNQQYAAVHGLGPALPDQLVRRGALVEKAVQTCNLGWEGWRPEGAGRGTTRGRPTKWNRGPCVSRMQEQFSCGHCGNETGPPPRGQGRRKNRARGWQMIDYTSSSPLKFDTDFDFDSANAKFIKEELDRELQERLIVKDVHSTGEEKQEHENNPQDTFGPKCHYDKGKSFFDNLSSDNKSRPSWAEERKRNLETFGVPGLFMRGLGFWGGYRGRRGKGMGTAPLIPSRGSNHQL